MRKPVRQRLGGLVHVDVSKLHSFTLTDRVWLIGLVAELTCPPSPLRGFGEAGCERDARLARMPHSAMLIDGKPAEAQDGRVIDIENPATRRPIAQVPRGGEADVDAAVQA